MTFDRTNQNIYLSLSIGLHQGEHNLLVDHLREFHYIARVWVESAKEPNSTSKHPLNANTDFFLIFICCFNFNEIFNRFTTFEGFRRTTIEHENDSLQLNIQMESDRSSMMSIDSRQPESTDVEYFQIRRRENFSIKPFPSK